jgi:hypothetical protein
MQGDDLVSDVCPGCGFSSGHHESCSRGNFLLGLEDAREKSFALQCDADDMHEGFMRAFRNMEGLYSPLVQQINELSHLLSQMSCRVDSLLGLAEMAARGDDPYELR